MMINKQNINTSVKEPVLSGDTLVCAECGFNVGKHDNYCKHCGVRMKRKLED